MTPALFLCSQLVLIYDHRSCLLSSNDSLSLFNSRISASSCQTLVMFCCYLLWVVTVLNVFLLQKICQKKKITCLCQRCNSEIAFLFYFFVCEHKILSVTSSLQGHTVFTHEGTAVTLNL